MFLLIMDGKTALAGAQEGVALCLQTVIPSLFPFLVLSALLMRDQSPAFPGLGALGRLCGVPEGAEVLLIPAFLGGYPLGAQCVCAACQAGQLSRNDGQRMLAFCNNAGPAFLFGIGPVLFPSAWMIWALWGIHLSSAVLVSLVLPRCNGSAAAPSPKSAASDPLETALHVMGLICGWVVLFRVVIAFLKRWVFWGLPIRVQVLFIGLLELTNGCCELPLVESLPLRFTLCAGFLALGGLCVTMQTLAVTNGLSRKSYCMGKLLQLVFSLFFCACLFVGGRFAIPGAMLLLTVILLYRQKKSRIPASADV